MIALLFYMHAYYMRSFRYFPPVLIYLLLVIWIYTQVPNPVMPSYAFTSTLLFVISAWLTFGFIDLEHSTQVTITALHAGSLRRTTIAKLLYLWIFTILLAILAVLYPAYLGKFDHTPSFAELLTALDVHISQALLGIAVSVFFSSRFIPRLSTSFPGIIGVVALSLGGGGIANALPEKLKLLSWLLPPVHLFLDAMNEYTKPDGVTIGTACLYTAGYSLILIATYAIFNVRKGLTS